MAVNKNLLLFIEPINPPSKEPLVDVLTCTMTAAFRKAESGTSNYSDKEGPYVFREGGCYRGIHKCSCGVNAGNRDYQLPNGDITTNLAIHYLAYHRDEISEEQLKRIDAISDEYAKIPTDEELHVPKGSEGLDIDKIITRPEPPRMEPSKFGDKRWTIGFADRGMGHGDFCVMEEDKTVVAKVEGNAEARDNAWMIAKACNSHYELIDLVEITLNMVKAKVVHNVTDKIDDIEGKLAKIKKEEL